MKEMESITGSEGGWPIKKVVVRVSFAEEFAGFAADVLESETAKMLAVLRQIAASEATKEQP